MSKVAFIFFGQVKNFDEKQYFSFEENIKKQIKGNDVDYFLVTSKSSFYFNSRQADAELEPALINYKSIQDYFEFEEIFYDQDLRNKEENISDLAEEVIQFGKAWKEGDCLDSIKKSLKQIYSLEYFINSFTDRINDYDYFILSRSDLFFTHPLSLECLKSNEDLFAPYYNICPQIDYGWFGGINDRFAIIKNKKALNSYCTRYSDIKNKPEYYHAEKYLLSKLKKDNISHGKINNFMFLMQRADGSLSDLVGTKKEMYMNCELEGVSKSYFINLDRRSDRLFHMYKNTEFSTQRVSAIDAKKIELSDEVKKLFPKTWQSRSKAEICCALSHYRLWEKLVQDKNAVNYFILEDDAVFKDGFVNFWNQVFSKQMPSDYSIIYFGGCQPWNKPQYPKVLERYNDYFCRIKRNDFFTKDDHFWHMNASSYVLSRAAASLLCQWVEQNGMDEALDNFMQRFFNKNKLFAAPESIYHLNPLMAYQLHEENDNTEIDKNSDLRYAEEKFEQNENKDSFNTKNLTELLIPLKTKLTKKRIGGAGDGGYVLLGEIFNDCDTVYSYGIDDSENSDSFDVECANYNKAVFMFDGTIQREQSKNPRLIFRRENLTADNLRSHLSINNNIDKKNMILKMDIEGHEYPVIEKNIKLINDCFSMMCIEFHGLNNPNYYNYENKNYVLELILEYYDIFHMHANNWVARKFDVPNVLEISFIRKGICLNELDDAYPVDGLDFPNCQGRDDYVLDWWITKQKPKPKNIFYWHHSVGRGNFGDELNIPVGRFLFGEDASFKHKQEGAVQLIHLIGSNLAGVNDGDSVSGIGLHHHTQKINSKNIQVNCVRGPLSLKALNQQLDQPVECFLGDPALLLKLFYQPRVHEELVDKIGVVPHISNIDFFTKEINEDKNFHLINPTKKWQEVINDICSCKLIISSSLHGLICADAFGISNAWIKIPGQSIPPCDKKTDYGDFKYWDYFMSQGRQVKFINSIHDDLGGKIYSRGNQIDLDKLKNSILGKNIKETNFPNLINISNKQIPKKIHLSWKNKNVLDSNYSLIKKGAKNLELLNPDWDIEVNDDEDVNRYIRDNIGKSSWELLKDRKITEKTDLWRLLKIRKEGGLYVDIDRYIDTPLSEIIKSSTSCVIPTFQDVDFSQDFVLSCSNNPMIERAISYNLLNRKNGKKLFDIAVCSYMYGLSELLCGQKVERGKNPEYFNDIRKKIDTCEYLETFREIGPEYHILYRNISGNFNMQTFEKDKADFYNGESVTHWNVNTQVKHNQFKNINKRKLVFLQKDLFEEDFILELFEEKECEKVFDLGMEFEQENSIIIYSDIYCKNINLYPEKHREFFLQRNEELKQYFNKCKNCILIHLSDEHCHADIDHYKNFKHVFRQYYRSDAVADNVTFMPLGYKKGFKL